VSQEFDYVIVGAGSAGCVLAARLTEDPQVKVLLVEAGAADSAPEIRIPAAFPSLFKTQFDWDYASDPEPGLGGRILYLPRGKVLGGSSSLNAMMYVRGNRTDYDEWSKEGAEGWSYDELLPYFKKAESNEHGANPYRGAAGPLSVQDLRSAHPTIERFVTAAVQAGYSRNDDFNGPVQEGVGFYQVTQQNGKRFSAADAYLHPAANRPNLSVLTGTVTTRIILEGRRATGLEIFREGQSEIVYAGREVILSAGTYNSPQILMLSGIGIPDDLRSVGVEAKLDLPVGEDLQDHPLVPLTYLTVVPTLFGGPSADDLALYEQEGRGLLSSNLSEGGGFFRTRRNLKAPNVQLHVAPVMYRNQGLSPPVDHAYTLGPNILKPTSRGKVSLRSARPDAKPRIVCNLLTTQEDRMSMIDGVRLAMEIAEMPALAAVRREPHLIPASPSDLDIWAFIEKYAQVVYHPTSTCGIGRVVDSQLRVLGLDNIRVVDASVMPTIVRGNTNAPVIAIAEKAADLIRGRAPAGS
jgi:choline dehydrogenase-like flavoprotein